MKGTHTRQVFGQTALPAAVYVCVAREAHPVRWVRQDGPAFAQRVSLFLLLAPTACSSPMTQCRTLLLCAAKKGQHMFFWRYK